MKKLYEKQVKKINKKGAPSSFKKNGLLQGYKNKRAPVPKKIFRNIQNVSTHNKKKRRLQLLSIRRSSRPSTILNLDFYRNLDGVYASYWLGKFINVLQKKGKKKSTAIHVYEAFTFLKYTVKLNPILTFFEILDKTKPLFKLRNYITRRVVIKQYPVPVLTPRRVIIAIHWLKTEINKKTGTSPASLQNKLISVFKKYREDPKKNVLSQNRNAYIRTAIKAQFNIRFTFSRK